MVSTRNMITPTPDTLDKIAGVNKAQEIYQTARQNLYGNEDDVYALWAVITAGDALNRAIDAL